MLDFASELLFLGDAGTTEASRPSRRIGAEINALYRPLPWLVLDLDAAADARALHRQRPDRQLYSRRDEDRDQRRRAVEKAGPCIGAIQLRYFGPRPLIEDNIVTSKPTSLVSARPDTG